MLQQFAQQMRPQMPDMTQQQLLAEYQRRMTQRQDIGQQTVQYDKVLQEFQQQQGIPGGSAHAVGPFIEVPHQRFGLRQPTPIVQPGLKPIMPYGGLDGQFIGQQQQLYKIQLQQQMMMQQQKKETSNKSTLRASPVTGKANAEESGGEVSGNVRDDKLNGTTVLSGNTNSEAEKLPDKSVESGTENEKQLSEGKGNSTSGTNQVASDSGETSSEFVKGEKLENAISEKDHCSGDHKSDQDSREVNDARGTNSYEEETGTPNSKDVSAHIPGRSDDPNTTTVQREELCNVTCREKKAGKDEDVEKDLAMANVNCDSPSDEICSNVANENKYEGGNESERCSEERETCIEPQGEQASGSQALDSNKLDGAANLKEVSRQEGKRQSKPEPLLETNQAPIQPHNATSQVTAVPPPQPQHFLYQQQFLSLQQSFVQMQQQRQVLVQQYQQLQQQLHQAGGQDPVLAGQVMTVQSQGQVLQQQMLQAWQQMQLIQQQVQLGGTAHQQLAIQQQPQAQQQPLVVPQWPSGVPQGHSVATQPGVFPVRPSVMAVQGPLQPGMPLVEKGLEQKPKSRSRSKSRDTPQPSPIRQQSPAIDWQPPKGKQSKTRQRKPKKSEPQANDPDLERQQQVLQQQIYQQMEQRHRLMKQKQGVFVEQGQQPVVQPPMPLQQPGQQPQVSLPQNMVEHPGIIAQPSIDGTHPMRPLSHTPELSKGQRPDSQVNLPPGTPGPQMPLPSSTQIPPGYPHGAEQSSFSQRFPTPEHYLQQFGQHPIHQRQPQVHYVAEANNPFSDQFQGLHSKGRGRGGAKKTSGSRKPGKPRSKKTAEVEAPSEADLQQQQQTNPTLSEQNLQGLGLTPSQQAQAIKLERLESEESVPQTPDAQQSGLYTGSTGAGEGECPDGKSESHGAVGQEVKEKPSEEVFAEQCIEANSLSATGENSNCHAPSLRNEESDANLSNEKTNTTENEIPASVQNDSSESADESKQPCDGTGLEALQKLESMVADMANEEEACKELEKQSELERIHLPLDDDVYDPEMDKIYERDFMVEETQFEQCLLSPIKAVDNGSQANSVASLECHEESLISPLLEETERRKERQAFFAESASSETAVADNKIADLGKPEVGKEHQTEEAELTPSESSKHAACNVTNKNGVEKVDHISSNAHPTAGQEKVVEETRNDMLQDANIADQDSQPQERDLNPTPSAQADVSRVAEVKENYSDSFTNQGIETAVPELTPSTCETIESVAPPVKTTIEVPLVNSVASVVTSNGEVPLASGGEHRLVAEQINCTVPVNSQESLPQQTANVASTIGPEALHGTVGQIPEALDHNQSIQPERRTPSNPARPANGEKPAKTPKPSSRPKNPQSSGEGPVKKRPQAKEEDPMKKKLQELRRQEYERKKREYEEQQKKKRELQKELRIQKQMIREQRKRQRIYINSNSRNKQKTEIESNASNSLKISTPNNTHRDLKPATPLSLCEPKLLLTHALTHPYGSRAFNGQCLLKGNFGSAKVDGMVDYYTQFPSSDMDIVVGHPPTPPSSLPPSPGIHQHRTDSSGKPLVNGDASPEEREGTELAHLSKPSASSQDTEHQAKRARYTGVLETSKGGVSVPPSMPTPPLSDSAATVSDRLVEIISSVGHLPEERPEANGKESSSSSSSTSPETVQYIASSSPESDAVNRVQTPQFSALVHRDSTDSPTFPAVAIKREQVEHYLDNRASCSQSCGNFSEDGFVQTTCKLEAHNSSRLENDTDDLDSINVTLTLSPTSEQRVTETVASVADLIGCSPPRHSDIVIEPAGKGFATKGFMATHSLTTPGGDNLSNSIAPRSHTSSDIYQKQPFSCSQLSLSPSEEKSSRKKPEGPYCRHCDVLIIGIGVKRKPEDDAGKTTETAELNRTQPDAGDYKIYGVNVEAGDCTGDIFCSEACLKQYFAHFGSACSSPTRECKPDVSVREPPLEATVTSVGQTSIGAGNVTTVSDVETRGSLVADGLSPTSLRKIRSPSWKDEDEDEETKISKRQRRLRWKRWQQSEEAKSDNKQRIELTPEESAELLEKHNESLKPPANTVDDLRTCTLCGAKGDGDNNASARLLNLDVDVWVHLNCALWSLEVYETLNGALMNVEVAVKRGTVTNCVVCYKRGATVSCKQKIGLSKIGCPNNYHFSCAISKGCLFLKDKTMLCHEHRPEAAVLGDHVLSTYAVFRKVYVNRDEIQQIASMLRHNQETSDKPQTLRVGSLVVKSLGQLLPHQLQSFHTRDAVYPVGFKTIRLYWSMRSVNRRCKYHCVVEDAEGSPSFTIRVDDDGHDEQPVFRGKTPRDVWQQILVPILKMRKEAGLVNLFPQYITGEDLFGLSEQYVLRIIESMPGVDQMQGYNMRYGPSPIMELPLAVNPTGSARSEPLLKSHFKSARARALRSASSSGSAVSPAATVGGAGNSEESSGLYLKQFVYSKATQYRKLKTEWKTNVFLGRSNIQGLGLFANKDMEAGSMVIEYIGSIIRNEVANRREQIYEKQNRGVYMFRIDSDAVIDATMAGGPARYINHSCMPNCVAEVVTFEKEQKIIIISNRKVEKGEELTYDYKFDFEDEENKIPCLCGAPNCRKWMN